MTLNVIVCGEGKSDAGFQIFDKWYLGPVEQYILNASPIELNVSCINFQKLEKRIKIQRFKSDKSKGHGVKAERLARFAKLNNYDIAICYKDCDRNDFNSFYNDMIDGFEKSSTNIVGIPMIPKEMIESWLLADEESFKYLGGIPTKPRLPKKPEDIWGNRREPDCDHPKCYINRVLNQYYIKDKLLDVYHDIASKSRPDELRRKCPISYGRFYEDMQRIKDIIE